MLTGLNHLTLAVADLPASIAFYRDLLGFRLEARWDQGAYLELGSLWLCLSREPQYGGPAADYTHYAFGIAAADFARFAAQLRAHGVREWKQNRSELEQLVAFEQEHREALGQGRQVRQQGQRRGPGVAAQDQQAVARQVVAAQRGVVHRAEAETAEAAGLARADAVLEDQPRVDVQGHVQRLGAQAVLGVHMVDEQFLVEVAEALVGLAGQQAAGGDQERGALWDRQAVQGQLPERQPVEVDGRQEAPVAPVEDPWAEQAGLTVARLQVAPLGGEEGAAGTGVLVEQQHTLHATPEQRVEPLVEGAGDALPVAVVQHGDALPAQPGIALRIAVR